MCHCVVCGYMLSIAASTQDRGAYDEKGPDIGWWSAAECTALYCI